MNCKSGYDSIVVLTGGMYEHPARKTGWKFQLNAHMRAAAAAELYHKMGSRKILVSGGKTNGEHNPALSPIMAEELNRNYKVPLDDILLEDKSIETTENAEFSARELEEKGLDGKVALVTTFYHLPRALTSFRNHGIDADGYSAESILKGLSRRHNDLIDKVMNEPGIRKTVWINRAYHAIALVPVIGEKILRYAGHATRNK